MITRTSSRLRAGRMCAALSFALLMPMTAAAERKVACLKPPGGEVICEDDKDVPKCKVENGQFKEGRCLVPPPTKKRDEIEAWILSDVTGTTVTPKELDKFREVLRLGRWQKEGLTVTFKLPEAPQ